MSKVSKCCGAKIVGCAGVKLDESGRPTHFEDYKCTKCHTACETKEKEEVISNGI